MAQAESWRGPRSHQILTFYPPNWNEEVGDGQFNLDWENGIIIEKVGKRMEKKKLMNRRESDENPSSHLQL